MFGRIFAKESQKQHTSLWYLLRDWNAQKSKHSTKGQFLGRRFIHIILYILLNEQVYSCIRACIAHCSVRSVWFEDRGRSPVVLGKCGTGEGEVWSFSNYEGIVQIRDTKNSALSYLGGRQGKRRFYLRSSTDLIFLLSFLLRCQSNGTLLTIPCSRIERTFRSCRISLTRIRRITLSFLLLSSGLRVKPMYSAFRGFDV